MTFDASAVAAWFTHHHDELVSVRRHIHAHPEVSGEEHETTQLLAQRLTVAGLEPQILSSGTGLLCDLGGDDGPLVALRADIDALAMTDEKDVPYRSQRPGVAHACGHDVHTAIVLGAGLHLAELGDQLPGRVRLVFQPAEERVPGGALDVIADGGLDGVDAMFGVHCDPKLDVGRIGLLASAITSASDVFTIHLTGPGGHTARPEETVDMVALAAQLADGLPEQVRERLADRGDVKLVFGSMLAGDAPNVIPTSAMLRGTIRTPSDEAWSVLPEILDGLVGEMVTHPDATYTIDHIVGVPPVVNDPGAVATVERAARRVLGSDGIAAAVQSWGGDDFAWYLRKVPGAYVRVGVHDPASGVAHFDLHAGVFDADERAIAVGAQVLVSAVYEANGL